MAGDGLYSLNRGGVENEEPVSETSTYRAEVVSRLRSATEDLQWMVRGLGRSPAADKTSPDEWSIHEQVSHLRDMEQEVYLPLLRWATVPEMLDPRDYNRVAWHESRYNAGEPLESIVLDIVRIREEELAIYREMTDEVWTRYRTDTRWGPLTCQWIAEVMYRHVLDHMQTIMALQADLHLEASRPVAAMAGVVGGARRG